MSYGENMPAMYILPLYVYGMVFGVLSNRVGNVVVVMYIGEEE